MKNKEKVILLKYFIVFFLLSFLIINWNEVSWIFNYRAVFGFLFSPVQSEKTQPLPDFSNSSPKGSIENNLEKSGNENYSEKENILEIPKIQISAPLVFSETKNTEELAKYLDKGVVYFPDSVLPGQVGQTVILGHSAPPGWPKIKYDWVFSRINELQAGDEIFIYFNNKKHRYLVSKTFFLQRNENLPKDLTNSVNKLLLISCWPPGKDIRRIAVEAVRQVP